MVPIDAARLPEGAPGRWSKVQPGMYAAVRYPDDPVVHARLVLWPYKGRKTERSVSESLRLMEIVGANV